MYTHEEYIGMVLRSGRAFAAMEPDGVEDQDEDSRMLAFFDSLLQVKFRLCNSDLHIEMLFIFIVIYLYL